MNTALWIAQGLLAVLFGMAGFMKAHPADPAACRADGRLAGRAPALTRFIGAAEIAGAIGVIVPILLATLPWLTPLAAAGFVAIQILAIGFHIRRRETAPLPFNAVLLALSLFVVIGRFELF
jgi:hypothetical protein